MQSKFTIEEFVKCETFKNYNEFFQCTNERCQKVFWNGPHIADIKRKIQNMTEN